MFKKTSIFFSLGVYAAGSVICLSLLFATYIFGGTSGISMKSFTDFIEICLGFLSLLTIPALFILAIVHGTIPEKLKASFYDLYISKNGLFICGAVIPIAMSVVLLVIYAVFLPFADMLSLYWIIFAWLLATFFVSPLVVKLLIMLKKPRVLRREQVKTP